MVFSPAPQPSTTTNKSETSPFTFNKGPSMFGDSTSRPKSPKGPTIENPFLKNPPLAGSGSGGLFGNSSASNNRGFNMTNSFSSKPFFQSGAAAARDPLAPLGAAGSGQTLGFGMTQQQQLTAFPKKSYSLSIPPPSKSLSLTEGFVPLPTQLEKPKPTSGAPFMSQTTTSPAPVSTPTSAITAAPISASSDDHWVVGYGFGATSMNQYQELMDILGSCGMIDQKISGGNWVAVHFQSRYSAEKAVSSQPIYSSQSNTYYGVSRVTSERLRILQQHKGKTGITDSGSYDPTLSLLAITNGESKVLEEEDVLMEDTHAVVRDLNRPTKPENICQQLLAWYFGWTYDTPAAPGTTNTAATSTQHPKSD